MEDAAYEKFCILIEMNRLDEAIDGGKEAIRKDQNDEYAYGNLAVGLLNQGQFKAAEDALHTSLTLNPEYAHGYKSLAYIKAQKNDHEQALTNILRAIELEPEAAEFHVSLGYRYLALGKKNQAIAAENEALRLEPENIEAMICLIGIYLENDDLKTGEQMCLKALEIAPDDLGILNNLGYIYGAKKAYRKAIEVYSDILQQDPNNQQFQENLYITIRNFYTHQPTPFNSSISTLPAHIQQFYKNYRPSLWSRLTQAGRSFLNLFGR